jgi:hypothetical protein
MPILWRLSLADADVCMNIMGLSDPVGFESLDEGRASQRKLASLSFDAAGFGHGGPITHDASGVFTTKYGKHPGDVHQQRARSSVQENRGVHELAPVPALLRLSVALGNVGA